MPADLTEKGNLEVNVKAGLANVAPPFVPWLSAACVTEFRGKAHVRAMVRLIFLSLFAAGLTEAAARPRILTQPKTVAIQAGQDVQVALNQLGRYDVEIRNSAGTVTSAPAWPGHLANRLRVRLRNYAQGGVDTAGIRTQINSYLRTSKPTTNTLIANWTGGPLREIAADRLPVERAVSNRLANVRQLAEAGARSLLIPRYFPFELMPFLVADFPHMTIEVGQAFDAQLDQGLAELEAEFPITFYRPDMFAFFLQLCEDPAAYGFRSPVGGRQFLGADFHCDDRHFTTAAGRVFAEEFYRVLTPPLRIDSAAFSPGGDLELDWRGDSPPFRPERTADLSSGKWQPVGEPTFHPMA